MITLNELQEIILSAGCNLMASKHKEMFETTIIGIENFTASGESQETALLGVVYHLARQFAGNGHAKTID